MINASQKGMLCKPRTKKFKAFKVELYDKEKTFRALIHNHKCVEGKAKEIENRQYNKTACDWIFLK